MVLAARLVDLSPGLLVWLTMSGLPSASVHSWTKFRLLGFSAGATAPASSCSFKLNRFRWFMLPPASDRPTMQRNSLADGGIFSVY
jgi:hypothetical protein